MYDPIQYQQTFVLTFSLPTTQLRLAAHIRFLGLTAATTGLDRPIDSMIYFKSTLCAVLSTSLLVMSFSDATPVTNHTVSKRGLAVPIMGGVNFPDPVSEANEEATHAR